MHCSTLRTVFLSAGLLACIALFAACGSDAAKQSFQLRQSLQQNAGLNLPSPAELLALKPSPPSADHQQLSREVSEFSRLAFAYDFQLPKSRVSSSGTNLVLEPQYTDGGPLSGAAYCLYAFDLESGEIDLSDPTLHLAESDLVQQGSPENLYVLFPNYTTNRWDSFNFSSLPGFAGPSDSADYMPPVSATTFYLAVLAVGNQPFEIKRVRIGNDPPVFSLLAFPMTGQAPLDVQFTADFSDFGSEDFDTIEWDFEGDGTFELLTATDVIQQDFQYTSSGTYQAACRITDLEGASRTETASIVVSNNLTRTWGNSSDERALDIALDASDNVYVCGKNSNSSLLLKFNSDLELQWSKSWKPADAGSFSDYRSLVCIGSDVYVAGTAYLHDAAPFDYDILLHKYASDGSLSLQKTYGNTTEDDEPTAITTDGSSIYLTGYTWDGTDDAAHFLAAKLDLNGAVIWGKHDALLAAPPFYDMGTAVEFWNNAGSIAFLAGRTNEFAFSPACMVALDYTDGTTNLQRYYSSDVANQQLTGKALLGHGQDLILLGNYDDGFDEGLFSFSIAPVGGAASKLRFIDSIINISYGAAAADPTATAADSIVFGGGTSFDAVLAYDAPTADPMPFDLLDGPGGFTSQIFGLQPSGSGSYFTCGYALFASDTVWNRDGDPLDTTQPGAITEASPGFAFEDWTPNAADTAFAAQDIAGTLDTGGGGQDIMVSKLVPGL